MNKTRLALAALLLAAASALHAGNGTQLVVDTKTFSLPAGTRISVTFGADYQLIQLPESALHPKPGTRSVDITDDMTRYRTSVKPASWDFTVGAGGAVPAKRFVFTFDRRLAGPPPGMIAEVLFPVTVTRISPDGKSVAKSYRFGMPIEKDPGDAIPRCLQLRGGPDGKLMVGVLPSCSDDPLTKQGLTRIPTKQP